MKPISTFFSTLILAAKRLWNHRILMLCLRSTERSRRRLAGLIAAVAP